MEADRNCRNHIKHLRNKYPHLKKVYAAYRNGKKFMAFLNANYVTRKTDDDGVYYCDGVEISWQKSSHFLTVQYVVVYKDKNGIVEGIMYVIII